MRVKCRTQEHNSAAAESRTRPFLYKLSVSNFIETLAYI